MKSLYNIYINYNNKLHSLKDIKYISWHFFLADSDKNIKLFYNPRDKCIQRSGRTELICLGQNLRFLDRISN